ncbi:FliM/FliN family flagellar motor switch protein [bacterium]|nr:FliM/FliN family flagellar motor switch protein [bacterium]
MAEKFDNSISTAELCKEYQWYKDNFSDIVQSSCDDFFGENFNLNLIALSQNINYLLKKEPCFVTKVKINDEYEVFFRLTDRAIKIILDKSLGESKNKFNLNKISELEAKIITAFNSFLFKSLKAKLNDPNPKELKRENYDIVNLTFLIQEKEKYNKNAGKVIVTLPRTLVNPEQITSTGQKFSDEDFRDLESFVKIIVGSTKFSLYNIKHLEQGDIVVFDNSNIENLTLSKYGEERNFKINPNMEILLSDEYSGGENDMADSQNLWDNIEVEIKAEFESVKISLGELKDIENGIVIDLASLYDNNVILKVENRPIASGELVIVNDRYGVKINNVISQDGQPHQSVQNEDIEENFDENEEVIEDADEEFDENEEENDEDFDYSDFELDDENI